MEGICKPLLNPGEVVLESVSCQIAVIAVPARPHCRMIRHFQDAFDQRQLCTGAVNLKSNLLADVRGFLAKLLQCATDAFDGAIQGFTLTPLPPISALSLRKARVASIAAFSLAGSW